MPVDLAQRLLDALPQTQCTRCGYPDCAAYAQAMASGEADINRCPPGGAEGVARLARIVGIGEPPALDTQCGVEAPRTVAWIDESWCIGCTLCIKACPTDAIVGSNKRMHTVIEAYCTGCELCVPVCPVDCIVLENASDQTSGWAAWSEPQADLARQRYRARQQRVAREQVEQAERLEAKARAKLADLTVHTHTPSGADAAEAAQALARKRAIIEAALNKAARRIASGQDKKGD